MPTPAEIRAELERRKNAVPAPAPAPAPAPSAQPSGAEAIRAELARRKAAPAPMTGSSGLGPVNPMVAEGRAMAAAAAQVNPTMSPVRPEARGDVAVRKPTLKAPPQRGPVMSPMQREAMAPERAAAEAERRAAQERREAAAAFGGGMDMLPVTDAAGNVSPGTDVDRDLSKTIISSPLQLGQGLAEGSANVINNLTGMAAEGVNTANRFLLGDKAVPFSGTNIQVPSNAIVDGDGALSSVGGLIPRVAGQFMAGRVPLGKALPNGGMGADIAKDALAFAATTDKETPRLSDMLPAGMMDGLRTREGEGYTEAFMKNALEDSVISSAAAGLLKLAGRVMDGPSPQQAGAPPRGTLTPTGNAPTSSLSPAERKAIDLVIRKLEADGVTIDEVVRTAAALGRKGDSGVYETLAEIVSLTGKSSGANTRGLAMAGGAVPGPTQQALIGRVAENADKLPDRLSRAATRATGQNADNAVATLDELETRLKTEAAPKYEEFYAAPVDAKIYDGEIAPVLNAPHGRAAMERAARGLGVEAASLQARVASGAQMQPALQRSYDAAEVLKRALDGENVTLPPLALDHVKRAFDDLIDEAGQGTYTATNLRGAKRNFAESVSRATGGKYGEALGTYENIKRLEEAFDIGLKTLNQKTWELERALAAGSRGSPFSGGEIEAIAMGVARNIEDMIEAGDQRALTALTKDKALKNIATALGSEKAAKTFEQSIRRLAANREFGRRVAGGSDTAMRQAAIRDAGVEAEDVVTKGLDAVERGNVPFSLQSVADASFRAGARKAKEAYRYFRYPGLYDEDVNKALAPLISEPMTETRRNALAASVNARQAERGARRNILPPPGGGAAPKATNKLKPPPRGPRPLPGQQSNSPPMIGGAALGALTSGGATYAATGDEEQALKAGILGGIGGGVVGSRFGKGSTAKAPPAVKPKPAFDQRFMKEAQRLVSYNGGVDKALKAQQYVIDQLKNSKAPNAQDRLNRAVSIQYAIRRMAERSNRELDEIVPMADAAPTGPKPIDPNTNYNIDPRGDKFIIRTDAGEEVLGAPQFSDRKQALAWLQGETRKARQGGAAPKPRSGPPGVKPPPVKNGVRGNPEAIGAGAGAVLAPDVDGDGEVSFGERAGTAISGGIGGNFLRRAGAMRGAGRVKPPPMRGADQAGIAGRPTPPKGQKAPPKGPSFPPRLAADLNKSKVSPATRATLDQNAALPPGERKSVMEATGWSDDILRIAAPYIRPGTRMESEVGNRIARLVQQANANPVEYALRQTMAKGAYEEAQKRFKQASGARGRAERNLEKLRSRNMLNPNQPATQQQLTVHKQRRDDAEQFLSEAARLRDEAKVMLDRADVELMSLPQVRDFANKEIQRITDALGVGGKASPGTAQLPSYNPMVKGPKPIPKPGAVNRPSKQAADELAHLLFEQDMAEKFAKIQSGEITPTQRNTFQQVMSWYARHPSLAAVSVAAAGGSAVGYAALATDQGERAVQARENARKRSGQPEPELPGPPAWDWEKLSRNPRFAGDTQAALQALGYKIGKIDNNIRRADGKRTESEKALYHFLWTLDNTRDPEAPPTEAEWDALKEAALQARRRR